MSRQSPHQSARNDRLAIDEHLEPDRWPELADDSAETSAETRASGGRAHGWGNFETSFDLATDQLRKLDAAPTRLSAITRDERDERDDAYRADAQHHDVHHQAGGDKSKQSFSSEWVVEDSRHGAEDARQLAEHWPRRG